MTLDALIRKSRWQHRLEKFLFWRRKDKGDVYASDTYLVFTPTEDLARLGAALLYSSIVRVVRSYNVSWFWGDTKFRFIYWIVTVEGLDLKGQVRRSMIALPNLSPQDVAKYLPMITEELFVREAIPRA